MTAIFKREFRSFFHGMLGYVLTAFLVASSGLYFLARCLIYGLTDFSYYTLYQTIFMLLLYIPVLAMRSLAEECHSRTDQLLLTSPVSVWGIVLGKFFAMAAVFALPCAVDAVMIFILWALGGTVSALLANLAGLLCYFLLGCAAIALCEFLSGLTENQIIAAVAGFSALLLAYLMPSLRSMFNAGSAVALAVFTGIAGAASLAAGLRTRSFVLGCLTFAALCLGLTGLFLLRSAWLTEAFSAVLSALCLFTPFEDFVNNSFSIPAVVYYLTVTAVFLFFTAQDIDTPFVIKIRRYTDHRLCYLFSQIFFCIFLQCTQYQAGELLRSVFFSTQLIFSVTSHTAFKSRSYRIRIQTHSF